MIREYAFTELGYFTEQTCEKIKKVMDDKTFMNFRVSWSNFAGKGFFLQSLMICVTTSILKLTAEIWTITVTLLKLIQVT